ncbi:uncharacterized protein LOC100827807 [Brachypodium distachyon]|uniref:uncharacterized protein LOC100827807 n=1 Tax=Brachypodium distachyon TaxID=15368 RepID=UPI00052FF58F|nr:uncharacterized protein LOC100827807 [Brachypodium distachyon]|eukprot:XP_010239108.1 uncharacterized protein LOC100827807 [Brachypodium distachyon]
MANATAIAADAIGNGPDWAGLPEELLSMFMEAMEIPDLVRSGAVCNYAPDAAGLWCPFTGDSVRVPLPLTRYFTVGSGHGWLAAADEFSNLRLLNPITGAQAALPPITALHHVESSVDAEGRPMYNVFDRDDPEPLPFNPREARGFIYHRAILSCSPSAGSACVSLLLHMPFGELSYARIGDERWTWISRDDHQCMGGHSRGFMDALYNDDQGLFYVLCHCRSVFTLNLNGPSPVVTQIMQGITDASVPVPLPSGMYILQAPWGDILQILRWRHYDDSSAPVEVPEDPEGHNEDDMLQFMELRTTEIEIYKVDLDQQKLVKMTSLEDHALFIGYNGTTCLPTNDFPMLKSNCVNITDDSCEYVNMYEQNWREIGVWDLKSESFQSFDGNVLPHPWLNWPSPVWITPSLF